MYPEIKCCDYTFVLNFILCLCCAKQALSNKENECTSTPLSKIVNEFGFKLAKKLIETDTDATRNVFISPLSVFMTLAILYSGATDESGRAIAKAYEMEKSSIDERDLGELAKEILEFYEIENEITLGNTAFIEKRYVADIDRFRRLNEQYYEDIMTKDVAVNREDETNRINQLVGNKTDGIITRFIRDKLKSETVHMLLNRVHFSGEWEVPFNYKNTFVGVLTKSNGQKKSVPTLKMDDGVTLPYYSEAGCHFIELAYKEHNISMLLSIPHGHTGGACNIMSSEDICRVMSKMEPTIFRTLMFSKFSWGCRRDILDYLHSFGMQHLYQKLANFSSVIEGSRLEVTKIFHQAVIRTNAQHTNLAAATRADIAERGECWEQCKPYRLPYPSDIYLRPISFYIVDKRINLVLFYGKSNDALANVTLQ